MHAARSTRGSLPTMQFICWTCSLEHLEDYNIINLKNNDDDCYSKCIEIHNLLEKLGIETIFDDRDESAGKKFSDGDLIGVPFQLIIGPRELKNGNVEVGVHIADVSHYIQPNSELDKEAYLRGNSIYLVDRVVPMLPEKLSNKLCSLRPNEDKLTFSALFEIDNKCQILNQWFGKTVIHSDYRFTYEQAQEIIEGKAHEIQKEINHLDKIAKQKRQERLNEGALNIESQEVKFKLDEQGNPIDIILKTSKDAHKLIEEFMLLANKKVAAKIGKPETSLTAKSEPERESVIENNVPSEPTMLNNVEPEPLSSKLPDTPKLPVI